MRHLLQGAVLGLVFGGLGFIGGLELAVRMHVQFVAHDGTPVESVQVCLVDSVHAMRCVEMSEYLKMIQTAKSLGDL